MAGATGCWVAGDPAARTGWLCAMGRAFAFTPGHSGEQSSPAFAPLAANV